MPKYASSYLTSPSTLQNPYHIFPFLQYLRDDPWRADRSASTAWVWSLVNVHPIHVILVDYVILEEGPAPVLTGLPVVERGYNVSSQIQQWDKNDSLRLSHYCGTGRWDKMHSSCKCFHHGVCPLPYIAFGLKLWCPIGFLIFIATSLICLLASLPEAHNFAKYRWESDELTAIAMEFHINVIKEPILVMFIHCIRDL